MNWHKYTQTVHGIHANYFRYITMCFEYVFIFYFHISMRIIWFWLLLRRHKKMYHWQFAAFHLCTLICAPIYSRHLIQNSWFGSFEFDLCFSWNWMRIGHLSDHFILSIKANLFKLDLFGSLLVKLWNFQCLWPFYFATVATLLTSFESVGFIPLETSIDETMKFRAARAFWKLLCTWTIEIVSM